MWSSCDERIVIGLMATFWFFLGGGLMPKAFLMTSCLEPPSALGDASVKGGFRRRMNARLGVDVYVGTAVVAFAIGFSYAWAALPTLQPH